MKKIIILNIPVIHNGYVLFFQKHNDAGGVYILGNDVVEAFSKREIRALNPHIAGNIISKIFFPEANISVLSLIDLKEFYSSGKETIIFPNEKISRDVVEKYFSAFESNVVFEDVFLKWDEESVKKTKPIEGIHRSEKNSDKFFMSIAEDEAKKSSDWWRRVGAVIVKDREVLFKAYNWHVPSEHTPYINGDPRDFVEAGKLSHICSSIHSEQNVIAQAAHEGVSLCGANIYVSVFPCPMCARLIALSGIKRCFFKEGHASLDGIEVLKNFNVELVSVSPL